MESGKRKRATAGSDGDGDGGGRRRPCTPAYRHESVSEAEVEEFFAILRRMRDATRSLAARTLTSSRPSGVAARWRPAFSWEDFAGITDGVAERNATAAAAAEEERVAENGTETEKGLDLNVEPDTDPEPLTVRSPRVDGGACCARGRA